MNPKSMFEARSTLSAGIRRTLNLFLATVWLNPIKACRELGSNLDRLSTAAFEYARELEAGLEEVKDEDRTA